MTTWSHRRLIQIDSLRRQSWRLGITSLCGKSASTTTVRGSEDGEVIARYILENPARKGLVSDAHLYAWNGTPDPM